MGPRSSVPVQILLVEDNDSDARLLLEMLRTTRIPPEIERVADGEEALAYLHREGKFGEAVRPDFVILDLNLPRISGFEVLAQMKADPKLSCIPVLILTTSTRPRDVDESYGLRASGYIIKPQDLNAFRQAVRSIEDYWLRLACLPQDADALLD